MSSYLFVMLQPTIPHRTRRYSKRAHNQDKVLFATELSKANLSELILEVVGKGCQDYVSFFFEFLLGKGSCLKKI